MKRRLLIGLLAFGTVGGFASGIASTACWHHRAEQRREAFERHVADVCVDAANRAGSRYYDGRGAPPDAPPPPRPYGPRGTW